MKYLKKFNENIVYHGYKNNEIDISNIGKKTNYFYLSSDYDYVFLNYANRDKGNVISFDIDTKKLLDLRKLGVIKRDFKTLQNIFFKETNLILPIKLQTTKKIPFWYLIRLDNDGVFKKFLELHNYDGFIMQEYHEGDINMIGGIFTSYVLINSNPIINYK